MSARAVQSGRRVGTVRAAGGAYGAGLVLGGRSVARKARVILSKLHPR